MNMQAIADALRTLASALEGPEPVPQADTTELPVQAKEPVLATTRTAQPAPAQPAPVDLSPETIPAPTVEHVQTYIGSLARKLAPEQREAIKSRILGYGVQYVSHLQPEQLTDLMTWLNKEFPNG